MMLPSIHQELPSGGVDTASLDRSMAQPQTLTAPLAVRTDYDRHRPLPIESLEHYIECRLADQRFRVS